MLIRKAEDDVGTGKSGEWYEYYGPYMVRSMDDKYIQVEDIKTDALLTILFPYDQVSPYKDEPHFPGHFVVQLLQGDVPCPFRFRGNWQNSTTS